MLLPALARAFTLLVKLSNLKEENMKKLHDLAKLTLSAAVFAGFIFVNPVKSEDLKIGFIYNVCTNSRNISFVILLIFNCD